METVLRRANVVDLVYLLSFHFLGRKEGHGDRGTKGGNPSQP